MEKTHKIRLLGRWEASRSNTALILSRKFHAPSGLSDCTQMRLVLKLPRDQFPEAAYLDGNLLPLVALDGIIHVDILAILKESVGGSLHQVSIHVPSENGTVVHEDQPFRPSESSLYLIDAWLEIS